MADKKKKRKKQPAKPKKLTAYEKAEKQYKDDKDKLDKAKSAMNKSLSSAKLDKKMATVYNPANKKYWLKMYDKQLKDYNAKKTKYNRINSNYQKSKKAYERFPQNTLRNIKSKISDRIAEQRNQKDTINEGLAAIYRTDGKSRTVIFISPGDTESEDTQSTVTSYAVDKGSPRSNYSRTSSKTVQVAGIIAGKTRADAIKKWEQLKSWNSRHIELTYRGSFTYHHLIISDLQQSFTTMEDNLKVSLTFTFVYAAEITISTNKTSKTKKSKSSKTTAGTRNKNYKAITIKYGDTLLALSRKYNKPVSWLMKVNKIKDPNKIYAGNLLYVSRKEAKKKRKVRVN